MQSAGDLFRYSPVGQCQLGPYLREALVYIAARCYSFTKKPSAMFKIQINSGSVIHIILFYAS